MEGETVLRRLEEAGVIRGDGDRIRLTDAFERRRDEIAADDGGPALPEWLEDQLADPDAADEGLIADVLAIAEFADDLGDREVVTAASALARLEDPPTADGAPEGFAPLYQEDLGGFLGQHRASVIFVWKQGSPSCAAMRAELDGLHELPVVDETVGLGSICADDGAELLRERYDVGLLPTTLFFVGESVDSRFWAPRPFESIRREVRIITDAAEG